MDGAVEQPVTMTPLFSTQPNVLTVDHEDLCARTLRLLPTKRAELHEAINEVARENSASAHHGPTPTDPNVLLLAEINRQMEGSMLPATGRRRVLDRAKQLGIRAFDASLLIAVAQDRARRGESFNSGLLPFQPTRVQSLPSHGKMTALWLGAITLGGLFATLGANWLLT